MESRLAVLGADAESVSGRGVDTAINMGDSYASVLDTMQTHIDRWEQAHDQRVIFLTCYAMMTQNMLSALERGEFADRVWVSALLHRFAEYYFEALDAYEQRADVPQVWQQAFETCTRPRVHVIQHLLLGVNAHINYDLVWVLVEMLRDEWPNLSPEQARARYTDHLHVNQVIYETLDRVQDEVVERYSKSMDIVDKLFLRADEWLLYRLIRAWREQVWHNAHALMACDAAQVPQVRADITARAVRRGQAMLMQRGVLGLRDLF